MTEVVLSESIFIFTPEKSEWNFSKRIHLNVYGILRFRLVQKKIDELWDGFDTTRSNIKQTYKDISQAAKVTVHRRYCYAVKK